MPWSPNVVVVDASILAPAVVDGAAAGRSARDRLRHEVIAGPDLVYVEVASVIRRQVMSGRLTADQAGAAVDDLLDLTLSVFPTAPLLPRAWDLRDNLTTYDACYVALAEALGCVLLTGDARLARAPGAECPVELFTA
jgi:predicted nucleic acid-binding protein